MDNSIARDAAKVCAAIATYLALMIVTNAITHNTIIALAGTNLLTAACVIDWRKHHNTQPLITRRRIDPFRYIGIILIVIIVSMGSTNMALWVKQSLSASSPIQNLMGTTPFATIIAASLIAAPLGEEALVRGFIYPTIRKHLSAPFTIALTACLFALLHGNLVQIVLTLPLGIVLGYLYEQTHDLRVCIGAHMLFNLMTVVLPSMTVSSWNAGVVLLLMSIALKMWVDTEAREQ
jgi:membrane protease YdiL (CAAX protease family)